MVVICVMFLNSNIYYDNSLHDDSDINGKN